MADTHTSAAALHRRSSLIALIIAIVVGIALITVAIRTTVSTTASEATSESATVGAADEAAEQAAEEAAEKTAAQPAPMDAADVAKVAGSGSLSGVRLHPLPGTASADMPAVADLGEVVTGQPTVVNVWAWNCAPCRQELPLLEQWAKDNPDVKLITVHAAREESRGQAFLEEIGVELPVYSDTVDAVGSALSLPRVVPVTVVFFPDGTMAKLHPGEFTSEAEITAAVREALA